MADGYHVEAASWPRRRAVFPNDLSLYVEGVATVQYADEVGILTDDERAVLNGVLDSERSAIKLRLWCFIRDERLLPLVINYK